MAGGIISTIYEEIYGKRFSRKKDHHHAGWIVLAALLLISLITFRLLLFVGVNSIYAALASFGTFTVGLYRYRRDLLQDALASGVLFTIVTFVTFQGFLLIYPGIVDAWWKVGNLSGVFMAGIPLEELLFAFGMGMAGGPLFEFVSGRRLVKKK